MRLLATFDDTCLNYIMQTFIYVVYSFCADLHKKMVVAVLAQSAANQTRNCTASSVTCRRQATGSVSVSITYK